GVIEVSSSPHVPLGAGGTTPHQVHGDRDVPSLVREKKIRQQPEQTQDDREPQINPAIARLGHPQHHFFAKPAAPRDQKSVCGTEDKDAMKECRLGHYLWGAACAAEVGMKPVLEIVVAEP